MSLHGSNKPSWPDAGSAAPSTTELHPAAAHTNTPAMSSRPTPTDPRMAPPVDVDPLYWMHRRLDRFPQS